MSVFLALAVLSGGCLSRELCQPQVGGLVSLPTPTPTTVCRVDSSTPLDLAGALVRSEDALAQADDLDRLQDAASVDRYYLAALQAARVLEVCSSNGAARQVYHRALLGLIDAGQRYGRLDPRRQLIVRDGGSRVVPISYFGFAWTPADFSLLEPADEIESREVTNHYVTPGLGLSLVGVRIADRPDEVFFRDKQPFAVTAILRPDTSVEGTGESVLEFYNPNVYQAVSWGGTSVRLARDLTAPFEAVVNAASRQYLRGFTAPTDTAVKPKLILLEPYQRGKIPVVFIHGLYSDPITWVDTINDLRSSPGVYQRYQFWVFRYPTGGEVLDSAAQLREKLHLARQFYAPLGDDPALDEMVLVGHSLGGLVSKMQIVTSYDILWHQVADQPFDALRAPPELEMRLSKSFFFEPLPFVTRVVFVGTPFEGSALSRRLAGRLGSSLVSFGSEEKAQYRELMDENRDVFKPIVARSRPTSVDLLEPTSPFLAALREMPIQPGVRMHTIIGTGGTSPFGEASDGVVSVSSARQPGAQSELYVPAKHEKLHRHPDSVAELARILRLHASEHALRAPAVAER